jgi:hypothetical protein
MTPIHTSGIVKKSGKSRGGVKQQKTYKKGGKFTNSLNKFKNKMTPNAARWRARCCIVSYYDLSKYHDAT